MLDNSKVICPFCGRSGSALKKVILGKDSMICSRCITLCNLILKRNEESNNNESSPHSNYDEKDFPTPKEIKEQLDKYIIGQDDAKRVLSVAVYNHYCRTRQKDVKVMLNGEYRQDLDQVEIRKSNICLIGPSGCGKTLLAETLAKILEVPFVIADATTLTETGYVGEDVENIIKRLWISCNYDVHLTERGIVCIDEADKLAKKQGGGQNTRDISGEGVQQSLLKLTEGTNVELTKQRGGEVVTVNTSNMLFIVTGAFQGLCKIIEDRVSFSSIGFGGKVKDLKKHSEIMLKHVEPEDIIMYGLIPEFVGRFPVIVSIEQLSVEQLVMVLSETINAPLKQYQKRMAYNNIGLKFDQDALLIIAEASKNRGTGARGLRSILETILVDIMYDAPQNKDYKEVTITKRFVTQILSSREKIKA